MKLTPARKRVLQCLVKHGGKAGRHDLGYPRSSMMHELRMADFVAVEGRLTSWGDPAYDGLYVITPAGRLSLSSGREP